MYQNTMQVHVQPQPQYGMVNNQMPMQPQYVQQPQFVQQPQYVQSPQYVQQPQYIQPQPQYPQPQPQVQPTIILNLQQPNSGTSVQPQPESSAKQPAHAEKNTFNEPPEWKNGLMGCCDDCGSCCLTMYCPCIQYGKNYEKVHKEGCCCQGLTCCLLGIVCLSCCVHKGLRSDIRQRYRILGGSDCCVTFFCAGCAICQEARELKDRH